MLKMKKEELAALDPVWNVTVVNVKTFVPATESQETYDKVFGKDAVNVSAVLADTVDTADITDVFQRARLQQDVPDFPAGNGPCLLYTSRCV